MKTDSFTFSSFGTVGRADAKAASSEQKQRKELESVVSWVRKQFENVPDAPVPPTAVIIAEPGTTMKVDGYLQLVISGVTYKIALVS